MGRYPAPLRPALLDFMSKVSKFSRDADKKKLDSEDYQVGYQELWSDFASKEQQQIGQVNAQNAQAWQNFSRQLQQASQQINQQQAVQAQQCDAIDIAPIASPGCKNICINGQWAEVC